MESNLKELPFIIVMAPAFRCCQCQRPLKPGLCALRTTVDGPDGRRYQFAFVVCGKRCQKIGLKQLAQGGRVVSLMTAREFRRLIDGDQLHRIAGIAQFSTWNGITVIEPFQEKRKEN
jgi:hypothetical protein